MSNKLEPVSGGKLTPIFELYDKMVIDEYDVHDRLWYEYFCPAKPHDKKTKLFLQDQLNAVGEYINENSKKAGNKFSAVEIVTSNKSFDMDEEGPSLKRPIYVETVEPKPAKKGAKAAPKKGGKIDVEEDDLMGETEDDLMGETTKPKAKPAAKKQDGGGKSNYDIIAGWAAKGKSKDEIEELTGLARKTITDNLWRWNKNKGKK